MSHADELNEYLDFATSLAQEAGEIMRKYFSAGTSREWKEDHTPVTVADTEINSLVIKRVSESWPDHSVLGEEESLDNSSDFVWVCDPVDGTMPYSHGLPISTFSLALCVSGLPVVAVVYDPFMDRMFTAVKGSGSFCNDRPLHVNAQGLQHSLVSFEGFPSVKPVIRAHDSFRDALIGQGSKLVSLWSAILPAALLADGQFTAVLLNYDQPQDAAAIKLIVEEAGGKVTDVYGNEQRYDGLIKGFIASNGIVHDELVQLLKEHTK